MSKKKTVRVSKKILASFGSGAPAKEYDEDDDLEFFDVEEPDAPVSLRVVEYGKSAPAVTEKRFSCMWCWSEVFPDDRGRFGKQPCPNCRRHGVTTLKMSDVKTVYIEDVEGE